VHARLLENVAGFGRVLRSAGIDAGPARMAMALAALERAGVRNRADVYWAFASALLSRPEQRATFDLAFELFFRRPEGTGPDLEVELWRPDDQAVEGSDSLPPLPPELLSPPSTAEDREDGQESSIASASGIEVSVDKHFDRMDPQELAAARRALERLQIALPWHRTRRRRSDPAGDSPDWRRSFRALVRSGGDSAEIARASVREVQPALVFLCDISASMQIYSRVILHFVCTVAAVHRRTFAFLLGTRLTDVSRLLRGGDIAAAVDRVCRETRDFDGGTLLGAGLAEFNRRWARRLLSRKAIVVLVSDGLEGADVDLLEREAGHLARSCGHLLWLNPLLRFEGFEPRAGGVRAIAHHAHQVCPVHSIACVADVATSLAQAFARRPGEHAAVLVGEEVMSWR